MRSRKLSPGWAVTSTHDLIGEHARAAGHAAPVRARLPQTGADSPVIADSSTVAAPFTTSPSAGISSPALTTTRSPGCAVPCSGHVRSSSPVAVSRVGPGCRTGWRAGARLRPAAGLGDRLQRTWRAARSRAGGPSAMAVWNPPRMAGLRALSGVDPAHQRPPTLDGEHHRALNRDGVGAFLRTLRRSRAVWSDAGT
jgi:hypothetical protein